MRRWLPVVFLGFGLCACLASDEDAPRADGGTRSPDGGGPVSITIAASGTTVPRDYLFRDGSRVARVTFTAIVTPAAAQVDWMQGGLIRGTGLPPNYIYTAIFTDDGPVTVSAVVHSGETELGRADQALTIVAPTASDCHGELGATGVSFQPGPTTMGIPDPVTVALPVGGIAVTGRSSYLMDCQMALAFFRMTQVLGDHHVTTIRDGGSGLYNYRCTSGSEQPPCTSSGFSLHAFGQAYDITQMTTDTGLTASFGTDWVHDTGATCAAASASERNQLLHDVVCDLFQNGIYSVVLTPNFQAAQDFVHVDLTVGQEEID